MQLNRRPSRSPSVHYNMPFVFKPQAGAAKPPPMDDSGNAFGGGEFRFDLETQVQIPTNSINARRRLNKRHRCQNTHIRWLLPH